MTTTNTQGTAILCEHEDGRYAVNPDTTGDPAWHRLGPVDISALDASTQSGLTDAYAGAREDLSIWKRRALEAERDLRSEKQTTSRLVGELNAANGPAYMGEPAASPAYGATEYGWADYRRLQDGDKRLIALVVNLYGNDHQSFSDLEGLLDRASRWQVPAQQSAPSAAADLIAALEEARSAINSMKVEAETAAQGDEQMMLEACEQISNEGLQADMAIRAALAFAAAPSKQETEATHLRELAAYRLTVENLEREIAAINARHAGKQDSVDLTIAYLDGFHSGKKAQQPATSPAPAVHSRHPVVVRWRNDGIEACAGIAEYYGCTAAARDMRVMLTAAPTAQADTQPAPAWSEGDVFRALIEFLLHADEAMTFLRCWNEGNFEACRLEWPEAPLSLYPYAARAPADSVLEDAAPDIDAAFEAVRRGLCKLPRYSFYIDTGGGVRKVGDKIGKWIEFDEAHALFDPISVDAARKQGASQ